MHAGFVDVPTLRRLEAAVWGDTTRGGAVRVTVSAKENVEPQPFDRDGIIKANRIPDTEEMRKRKETPGLKYHSFGTDERRGAEHVRRFFVAPGAQWDIVLTARAGQLSPASEKARPIPLPADVLLGQARAALALLCHFGGAGAKARKGFGSFADLPNFDLGAIERAAADFRAKCGLGAAVFQDHLAGSPALRQMLEPVEVPTGGTNYWLALDQLAAAAQHFAKRYKHRLEKKALGLPRRVGAPTNGTFRAGRRVKDRHASPVMYHFDRVDGHLVARVVAFPAAELPDLTDSRKLLQELLDELRDGLGGRFDEHVKGKPPPSGPVASAPAAPRTPVAHGPQLKAGQRVKARIVNDPKDRGRPFAECQGLVGNILSVPVGHVPTVGEEVELVINSVNVTSRQIAFKWLT
jgi:CRISPR-associated protein Cmr6